MDEHINAFSMLCLEVMIITGYFKVAQIIVPSGYQIYNCKTVKLPTDRNQCTRRDSYRNSYFSRIDTLNH